MADKKQIILIVVSLLIVSGGIFAAFLYTNQMYHKEEPYSSPAPSGKITASPSAQWTTYYNPRYHYRIDYPPGFYISHLSTLEGIAFAKVDDVWEISVHIEPTTFHTLEEWTKTTVEENRQYRKYKEKNDIPTIKMFSL